MESLKKRRGGGSRQIFEETMVTVFQFIEKMETQKSRKLNKLQDKEYEKNHSKAHHKLLKTCGERENLKANPKNPKKQKDLLCNVKRTDVSMTVDFSWEKMQVETTITTIHGTAKSLS